MKDKDYYADCCAKFKEYVNSAENINICKTFQEECQRFVGWKKEYQDAADFLNDQCKEKVVREEYGVGGEMLDRGYYFPNPVYDIVIGNCNRGKLLKRITEKSKISFTYGFDISGKLIVVNRWIDGRIVTSEYLIYSGMIVLGITFSSDDCLVIQICEEEYDGEKIQSLTTAYFREGTDSVDLLNKDVFSYDESGIKSCELYSFDSSIPHVQHLGYHFKHDDNGYLSKFTAMEYAGENIKETFWQNHEFQVSIKRKV